MVDQGLLSYLYHNLQQGYDAGTLRAHLYKQGYDIQMIDEALRYIQAYYPQVLSSPVPQQQNMVVHHHSVSPKTIFFLFLFFVLLPGAGFMVYKLLPDGTPEQLLDITTTPLTKEVKPGDEVIFEVSLEAYGSQKRFDAKINSVLQGPSGDMIDEASFVQAVETKSSKTMKMEVPDDAVKGTYKILTTVSYNKVTEESSFTFRVGEATVVSKPTCSDGIENQGEEGTDCGGPCEKECALAKETCSDGIRNQGELKTDCGGPCKPCAVSCANCVPLTPCTDAKCVDNTCVYTERIPCCGNIDCESSESHSSCPADCDPPSSTIKTPDELVREAAELAATDAESAARLCSKMDAGTRKDRCFGSVAKGSKISTICINIQDDQIRDGCYLDAAMGWQDYSVCGKVVDVHLRNTCTQLSQYSQLKLPEATTES